jgi:hypothetical protein
MPVLTAPFELQLLRRSDAVLTVYYHELLVLDFILVLRRSLQESSVLVNGS